MNLVPPIPADEDERIAAVLSQRLLDTPPEVEFDVTTRLAAKLFEAPIALVALMDRDRLWFKSKYGLAADQLDRKIAFCAYAIMRADESLVVENLAGDQRFADNPLVTGPLGLRFYAGAPLVDAHGNVLGTVAVLDTAARTFDEADRALLKDLSVSVMTAIDARRRAIELEALATTDPLTGVGNRLRFEAAHFSVLSEAAKSGKPIALLYADLDDFKLINDRYGHQAGDKVLAEVARRLNKEIRAGDTLVRLGGDEFAVVMSAGSDRSSAESLAQRFVVALDTPFDIDIGRTVRVGVSIGVAVSETPGASQNLLEKADEALYRAKTQVARRWHVAGTIPEVPQAAGTLSFINTDESRACEGCDDGTRQPFPFSMAFQPIVNARTHSVLAYEALVRGVNGETAASILAKVTRQNRYAFDQCCRRTAIDLAHKLGLLETDALLSINFIPGAMYEPENCVRTTLKAAQRVNMPLNRLIFEVTEGEEILHPGHLAKIFRVYREHGFMPAIDDFGAGSSGLNLLAEFQPSIIKIDRALIQGVDSDTPRQAIIRGILSVCSDLGILPIAEGVESLAEYRTLSALGIDLFQGYLFARPEFEALPAPVFPSN